MLNEIKDGILLLIGLPGAGKSTLSSCLRNKSTRITFLHVEYDCNIEFDANDATDSNVRELT